MPNNPELWALMRPHFHRVWHDIKTFNLSDLFFHALVNIPVEFCRADPYRAGHWMTYLIVLFFGYIAVDVLIK